MAAPRSRPARMLPSAFASAPANFALTPSSLISFREDTTCPPTSRASAGTPATSKADASRAASATEAEKRRSDPGRPRVRSVPFAFAAMSPSFASTSTWVSSPLSFNRASTLKRPVATTGRRRFSSIVPTSGCSTFRVRSAPSRGFSRPRLPLMSSRRFSTPPSSAMRMSRPENRASSGPNSPVNVVAYLPTRPLPEIARRSALPGAMVSVSRSATRSGLPRSR